MALDAPGTLQAALPGSLLEVFVAGSRPPVEALAAMAGVDDVQVFGDRAHVRIARADPAASGRIVAGLSAAGMPDATARTVQPSLEDVFIHLVTRAAGADAPAGEVR